MTKLYINQVVNIKYNIIRILHHIDYIHQYDSTSRQ